tara:strand:+ start:164 stop:526 length:363 start_codon:yes stop_codon:yes gene_type:complete
MVKLVPLMVGLISAEHGPIVLLAAPLHPLVALMVVQINVEHILIVFLAGTEQAQIVVVQHYGQEINGESVARQRRRMLQLYVEKVRFGLAVSATLLVNHAQTPIHIGMPLLVDVCLMSKT